MKRYFLFFFFILFLLVPSVVSFDYFDSFYPLNGVEDKNYTFTLGYDLTSSNYLSYGNVSSLNSSINLYFLAQDSNTLNVRVGPYNNGIRIICDDTASDSGYCGLSYTFPYAFDLSHSSTICFDETDLTSQELYYSFLNEDFTSGFAVSPLTACGQADYDSAFNRDIQCFGGVAWTYLDNLNRRCINVTDIYDYYAVENRTNLLDIKYFNIELESLNGVGYAHGFSNLSLTDIIYSHDNIFPELDILDLESSYCLNTSSQVYNFYLNATDVNNDDIYYFSYWNYDYQLKTYVDTFSEVNYDMLFYDWAFNDTGCNYSNVDSYLELYNGCDNIAMIKWLDSSPLNTSIDISFNTWLFHNTSAEYCIFNWHNEKILCIKASKDFDFGYYSLYTNFSYFNGSSYVYFDTSYYSGEFNILLELNDTHVNYCINGLDEASSGCNYVFSEELHGITDNVPAKFYLVPSYNWMGEFYQPSFIMLDEIYFEESYTIPWKLYTSGDYISGFFDTENLNFLTVYVSDLNHLPEYRTYDFPIRISSLCEYEVQYNDTHIDELSEGITTQTRRFISAYPNGPSLFNNAFYFVLFILLVILMFATRNLSLSLVLVGICGSVGALILSGDLTQIISSATLLALGLTMLFLGVF